MSLLTRFQGLILPDTPGIYLFYNKQKELIYVGKATSLKNRVQSYFRLRRVTRPIEAMMPEVTSIKYKTTSSVLEAVILEANQIKTYLPKYNVIGKDNRSWNYIVIIREEYLQVKTMRQHEYEMLKKQETNNKKQIELLGFETEKGIQKKFQYIFGPYPGLNMRAALKILRQLFHFSSCLPRQKRPCFYYQLGQCYGVCTGEISPREYKKKVIGPLVLFLKGQKKKLVKLLEKQMKLASRQEDYEEAGRLRNQLKALYRIQDITVINREMVELGESRIKNQELRIGQITQSKTLLIHDLKFIIQRIEGYDISNLGPTGKVGSLVVFDTAGPVKSEYRKFKIKTVAGQSDVNCLEEVIRRRFTHHEWSWPDLILIDGGRPQVNRVEAVLEELNFFIPVVGIAKGPTRKKNEFTFARSLFVDSEKVARDVVERRRALVQWVHENQSLLIRVRDEAHRFAISYQRNLRKLG